MSKQKITPRRNTNHTNYSTSYRYQRGDGQAAGGRRFSGAGMQDRPVVQRSSGAHGGSLAQRKLATNATSSTASLPLGLSPLKVVLAAVVLILTILAFLLISDIVGNFGKIHSGVTIQNIDVGGLSREEAAAVLNQELGTKIASAPVTLFANQETLGAGVNDATIDVAAGSTAYDPANEPASSTSWSISKETVGASFDALVLAEQAYAVGRGGDFFTGRFRAGFGGGLDIAATLNYDATHLEGLKTLLAKSIGTDMKNSGVEYFEGSFRAFEGVAGIGVDHNAFVAALNEAFLGDMRAKIVPMVQIPMDITLDEANQMVSVITQSISLPVTLVYGEEEPWSIDAALMGPWIAVAAQGSGADATLVPTVNVGLLESELHAIIGERDPGIKPVNAGFDVVGGELTITPGQSGTGIDYNRVAADLERILFAYKFADGVPKALGDDSAAGGNGGGVDAGDEGGADADSGAGTDADSGPTVSTQNRQIMLTVSDLEPEFTSAMAEEMQLNDKIATYTTEFSVASSNKITNIKLAADLLNNSMIAPGSVWSFNETAGECNAERGFMQATSIVNGEYVDEIGGGICQVATTIFNAAFESGLPIVERVNHGFYMIAYPAGRDAAVSWQWPDLKFENDTAGWILMTLDYSDTNLTCTLWGTNPGYKVESSASDFTDRTDFKIKQIENPELDEGERIVKQEGVRGRTIVVTRYVYDSQGNLLRETAFRSVYAPEPEIVEVKVKDPNLPNALEE